MRKFLLLIVASFFPLAFNAQSNIEEDIVILKKLTHDNILYSLKKNTEGGLLLTGIACNEEMWGSCYFYVYRNFGNVWQYKFKSEPIMNFRGNIDNYSFDESVFYFGSEQFGGTSGNGGYYFNAYNIEENKLYSLEYYWTDYNYTSHGFANLEEITNPTILSFLEEKVSQSTIIHRPSAELTLEDQWKIDNKDLYKDIFYDTQKIEFQFQKNLDLSIDEISAENKDYILYNFFKDNLYGYKKKTEEFFLIWVPSWYYTTAEILLFDDDDENVLAILDRSLGDNGARVYINLNNQEIYGFYRSPDED